MVAEVCADHVKVCIPQKFGISLFCYYCLFCRETWGLKIKLGPRAYGLLSESKVFSVFVQETLCEKFSDGQKSSPPDDAL